MGDYLSRDDVLASTVQTVDVEAFGGTVCVKEMDALTMERLMKAGAFVGDSLDFGKIDIVQIATDHMVDPDTLKPLLKRSDVEKLAQKGWGAIFRIVSACMEASGLQTEEMQPEKN